MRGVHVTDFKARALTAQTARPKGAQAPLVGQFGQWIRLIHELRELTAPEEITNHGGQSLRIDEFLGSQFLRLRVQKHHAVARQTFRARQSDPALILHQFAHRANAAAAEMVNIINRAFATAQTDEILDSRDKIFLFEDAAFVLGVKAQLLLNLIAPHPAQIVAARIKEQALEKLTRIRGRRGIARTQLVIDFLQRVVGAGNATFLADALQNQPVIPAHIHHVNRGNTGGLQLFQQVRGNRLKFLDQYTLAVRIHHVIFDHAAFELLRLGFGHVELFKGVEQPQQFLIRAIAQGAQECHRQEFAAALFAIQIDIQQVRGVKLHFDPGAPVGDDAERMQQHAVGMHRLLKANAGRAVQLADNHAFGAIDDKSALLGNQRDFAHEHRFFADFILGLQTESHMQRSRIRFAFLQALQRGLLGRRDFILHEIQDIVPVKAMNGEHFLEYGLQTNMFAPVGRHIHLQKLMVRASLNLNEIRQLDNVRQLAKIYPVNHPCHLLVGGENHNIQKTGTPRGHILCLGAAFTQLGKGYLMVTLAPAASSCF